MLLNFNFEAVALHIDTGSDQNGVCIQQFLTARVQGQRCLDD